MIVRDSVRRQAVAAGNFSHLWRGVEPLIALADVAFLNFEGTAGGVTPDGELVTDDRDAIDWTAETEVFTSMKIKGGFNYPAELARDLRAAGFGVASLANNHAMDRSLNGINETLRVVRRAGLLTIGTRRLDLRRGKIDPGTELEEMMEDFVAYTDVKGWRVAWVGCAMVVNNVMLRK